VGACDPGHRLRKNAEIRPADPAPTTQFLLLGLSQRYGLILPTRGDRPSKMVQGGEAPSLQAAKPAYGLPPVWPAARLSQKRHYSQEHEARFDDTYMRSR
jgi:hypothetical protein